MADVNQPPMPRAIVDAQGRPTTEFGIWMQQLWLRTGGGTDRFDAIEGEVPSFAPWAGTPGQELAPAQQVIPRTDELPSSWQPIPSVEDLPGVPTLPVSKGEWTPTIVCTSVAGSNTYNTQTGYWRRLGDLCWVTCTVVASTFDGASAGNVTITGLPFPAAVDLALPVTSWLLINGGTGEYQPVASIAAGATVATMLWAGDNTTLPAIAAGDLTNFSGFIINGWYYAL